MTTTASAVSTHKTTTVATVDLISSTESEIVQTSEAKVPKISENYEENSDKILWTQIYRTEVSKAYSTHQPTNQGLTSMETIQTHENRPNETTSIFTMNNSKFVTETKTLEPTETTQQVIIETTPIGVTNSANLIEATESSLYSTVAYKNDINQEEATTTWEYIKNNTDSTSTLGPEALEANATSIVMNTTVDANESTVVLETTRNVFKTATSIVVDTQLSEKAKNTTTPTTTTSTTTTTTPTTTISTSTTKAYTVNNESLATKTTTSETASTIIARVEPKSLCEDPNIDAITRTEWGNVFIFKSNCLHDFCSINGVP